MKFGDITKNKRYYKTDRRNTKLGKGMVNRLNITEIFVLDKKPNEILASMGGAPAQWYGKTYYRKWITKEAAQKIINEPVDAILFEGAVKDENTVEIVVEEKHKSGKGAIIPVGIVPGVGELCIGIPLEPVKMKDGTMRAPVTFTAKRTK